LEKKKHAINKSHLLGLCNACESMHIPLHELLMCPQMATPTNSCHTRHS